MKQTSTRRFATWIGVAGGVALAGLMLWTLVRPSSVDGSTSGSAPSPIAALGSNESSTTVTAGAVQPTDGTPTAPTATTTSTEAPPSTTSTTTTTIPRPRTTAEGSESDPVPVGEVIEFPETWDIVITSVEPDATEAVLGFADINPVPQPGFQYVMVEIAGSYLGDEVAEPAFEWAIESGATTYTPWVPGCGVIPRSLYDTTEVAPGQSFTGQLCMPVETSRINDMVLYLELPGDPPKYFDLTR